MLLRKVFLPAIALCTMAPLLVVAPSHAATPQQVSPPSTSVEAIFPTPPRPIPVPVADPVVPKIPELKKKLKSLKFPITDTVTKQHNDEMKRSACTWRDIMKNPSQGREKFAREEKLQVMETSALPVPKRFVTGLNINKTCQTVIWVAEDENGERFIRRIMSASTGASDSTTPNGKYRIYRETNRWHESTSYPGAMMYRPKYFKGGVAFHGSATDWYVRPYPASKGCVRMLHDDIDRLWKAGLGVGTPIKVYGKWSQ